jgi:hypothetical protein
MFDVPEVIQILPPIARDLNWAGRKRSYCWEHLWVATMRVLTVILTPLLAYKFSRLTLIIEDG